MANILDNLGDIRKLQEQAKVMQKSLQAKQVTVEKQGVKVVLRGDQKIVEITVDGVIENRITEAINDAIKQTQQMATKELLNLSRNQWDETFFW